MQLNLRYPLILDVLVRSGGVDRKANEENITLRIRKRSKY